jgi:CRISPR-associated protein Cmr3
VFYGAICSAYATQNNITNPKDIKEATKNLVIKGIYLHDNGVVYLPLPLDLVQKKNKTQLEKEDEQDDRKVGKDYINLKTLNKLSIQNYVSSNLDNITLLGFTEEVEELEAGLLGITPFKQYLQGNTSGLKAKQIDDFIQKENKIGIQRTNETHISEDGRLYRVGMNRLTRLKFCIEFEGLEIAKKGLLKLGGEGKTVKYDDGVLESNFKISHQVQSTTFKLVLKTPAIFENGWLPNLIDNQKIKLLSACIGKAINIGGFDMIAKEPKYMCKAVPAGSVYYLEADNEQTIKDTFASHSISDNFKDNNYQNQGFGLYQLANLKN